MQHQTWLGSHQEDWGGGINNLHQVRWEGLRQEQEGSMTAVRGPQGSGGGALRLYQPVGPANHSPTLHI